MDRLHEIIGHLREEEYDAVLYGVMLRFLEKKKEQYKKCVISDIMITIDEDKKTIDVIEYINESSMEVTLREEVNVNEA